MEKWKINKNIGKKGEIGVVSGEAPYIVAIMGNPKEWPAEAASNARLIAAAPLLLEALEGVVGLLTDKNAVGWDDGEKGIILAHLTEQFGSPQVKSALSAIKAARGE